MARLPESWREHIEKGQMKARGEPHDLTLRFRTRHDAGIAYNLDNFLGFGKLRMEMRN